MIDFHSHVLPHLDDGAKDVDMAVKMLEESKRQGVKGGLVEIRAAHALNDALRIEELRHAPRIGEAVVFRVPALRDGIADKKHFAIKDEHLVEGIAATRFPARFELCSKEPVVILDGAHNVQGAKALADCLEKL